ncbi:MAG: tRNA (adenosine(37)-N6)-threonylcarbamoyltransferase complex transferase subunit TsaD [Coriobacteriales bacterium]|jgi:tRNA threonylcarbamoyl adenosine modification protein TsaD/tRNA threonylcarbamoyl adenosine modification protein YeaZ
MSRDVILAFDTSTERIALGAAHDLGPSEIGKTAGEGSEAMRKAIVHTDSVEAKRCANQRLISEITRMMDESSLPKESIGAVVCGRGPGSFTGVRIGVATAKGIASGLGCPLYGASTLDAVAWEAWAKGFRGHLGVVNDALRKEVYPVRYEVDDSGIERLDPDNVDKPAAAAERWASYYNEDNGAGFLSIEEPGVFLAGDGLAKFATVFADAFVVAGTKMTFLPEEYWEVTGRGLLLAYYDDKRKGLLGSGHPQELLPVYTRLSDAEENEKVRKALGKPMRGVLVNKTEDFVEKSDSPEGLDPSSAEDVPQTGVALEEKLQLIEDPVSRDNDLSDLDIEAEHPLILAIESSCDETAAAVVDGDKEMISDLIATQIDFHKRFGGVVPEIASRKHTEAIVGLVEETMERAGENLGLGRPLRWNELDAIAVTQGPGLVGALVVGMAYAKGLSWSTGLPLIGVNHMEGHIYANQLVNPDIKPPMVVSLVSGGHTMLVHVRDWGDYEVLGQTLDDAVGEAYDKVAKALGLGYPGGPVISKLAAKGDPNAIDFPRAMLHSHDYRFSLSGLKTAVMTYIKGELDAGRELNVPNIAASFQQAVIDVQVAKAVNAVRETGVKEFCLGGGVAANPELRKQLKEAIEAEGVHVTLPDLSACTDNAAMIAAVAVDLYGQGEFLDLEADSLPNMPL